MQTSTPSRPVRNCQHPGRIHRHGTRVAYVKDRCRCPACTAANTTATRTRRRNALVGRPSAPALIDATPAREHIARLRTAGVGYQSIGRLAGTSTRHLRDIARDSRTADGRAPIRRIRADLAEVVLAIDPTSSTHLRAALGTRRRLTALIALGWPLRYLADRLGRRADSLTRTLSARHVTRDTAEAAARLYEELSALPPPATPATEAARRCAQRHGWVPPLAWDDIDTDPVHHGTYIGSADRADACYLDDIAIEAAIAGRLTWRQITDAEAAEVVRRLVAHGHSTRFIAARLHASRATIRRYVIASAA